MLAAVDELEQLHGELDVGERAAPELEVELRVLAGRDALPLDARLHAPDLAHVVVGERLARTTNGSASSGKRAPSSASPATKRALVSAWHSHGEPALARSTGGSRRASARAGPGCPRGAARASMRNVWPSAVVAPISCDEVRGDVLGVRRSRRRCRRRTRTARRCRTRTRARRRRAGPCRSPRTGASGSSDVQRGLEARVGERRSSSRSVASSRAKPEQVAASRCAAARAA